MRHRRIPGRHVANRSGDDRDQENFIGDRSSGESSSATEKAANVEKRGCDARGSRSRTRWPPPFCRNPAPASSPAQHAGVALVREQNGGAHESAAPRTASLPAGDRVSRCSHRPTSRREWRPRALRDFVLPAAEPQEFRGPRSPIVSADDRRITAVGIPAWLRP
jgi:hypothetical protein